MKDLTFSTNWNKKLGCDAFTTLRMSNKYEPGDAVRILLQKKKGDPPEVIGLGKVHGKRKIKITDINDFLAYVDTGYNAEETRGILHNMYKNRTAFKNTPKDKRTINLYLIRKVADAEMDPKIE